MVRHLKSAEVKQLLPSLRNPIEYRKSGLSLNHVIGCPLECAYCVRHIFHNYSMKEPRSLMSDDEAVELLVSHRFFQPHLTPIQIFNRATDPLLPAVKKHTFNVLEMLKNKALTNHVLIITRFRVSKSDCERLNDLAPLRVTLLITYSGISDPDIEPIPSKIAIHSLSEAWRYAERYRVVLYWRPIVPGLNDTPSHLNVAIQLSDIAHATVFTGLFFRAEIENHFKTKRLPLLYDDIARRKILPRSLEAKVIAAFRNAGKLDRLFRKTSCAVSYCHEQPDYNGHYCINEICDICPKSQVDRCRVAHQRPNKSELESALTRIGTHVRNFRIGERAIELDLDEEHRYYVQHALRYQVHSPLYPHKRHWHGRADIGWLAKN